MLDVHKAPFYNSSGEMIGTVGCGRDVTKEKEAQDALERARKVLREIAGDVDGIAVQGYDEQRMVTLWNKASEGLYGYSKEEALGKKLEDLIIPERMREGVIRAHERWLTYGERIPSGELVLKSKTGKDVHVYSSHSLQQTAVGKEMFCIDIDLSPIKKAEEEKRLLYEQLEKAQKMEAIGTLAGGIAHDFNNILSAITGYAELASNELPKGSSAAEDIALLLQASKRAAELVKQILTFSRKTPQDKRPLRAQLIVKEAMNMMRSSLPSTIDIKTSYSVHREMIIADPTGVHQVVVNLCTNALYAMKDQKGKLCISLELEEVDRRRVAGEWEVESGTYVVLGVEDNGHGMDEKILSQIFEPYFTTKERGDGTGLGLAMVHGIVKRCRGFIEVRSSPGEGTCFQVYFPLYKKTEKGSADVFVDTPLPRGNEHILFVDDEAALCHIAQSILSGLGYQVTTETESLSALERFREDPYGFDLVISDQTMPQLTGVDLAGKILALRPEVPFLLCTGYSSAVTKEAVLNMGIRQFVEKPLSRRALAESVRQVLDTPVK